MVFILTTSLPSVMYENVEAQAGLDLLL